MCTLDIREAQLGDTGEYKCVIQDFGKEGANETKCRVEIEEFEHKFTSDLKGKKVVEDETAVFELGVEEDDAEVKWYKDGVEIVPDGKRLQKRVWYDHPLTSVLLCCACRTYGDPVKGQ